MRFRHVKCNGEVDTETKTCRKCKKKWNWFTFHFNLNQIRPIKESDETYLKTFNRGMRRKMKK